MTEVRLEKTEVGTLLFHVMAERDSLRAENQGLHAENGRLLETNGDLRAEIERLRAVANAARGWWAARDREAQYEAEKRMVEALDALDGRQL